jgi:outer membrane protein assembly factor BamB
MSDRRAWLSRRGVLAGAVGMVGSLSGCATLFPDEARPPDERDWPMGGYDPAGTYHKPEVSGPTGGLEEVWRTRVRDGRVFAEPTLYDGRVYLQGADTTILDAGDGTVEGQVDTRTSGALAVATDTAYRGETLVAARRGRLVGKPALAGLNPNPPIGGTQRRWRYRETDLTSTRDGGPAPVVVDGTAYVGVDTDVDGQPEGAVAAVDASSGRPEWVRVLPREQGAWASPVARPSVTGDRVYAGTWLNGVFALDRADGSVLWHRPDPWETGLPRGARPVAAPDGPLVVIADYEVVGLTLDTGERLWSRTDGDGESGWYRGGAALAEGTLVTPVDLSEEWALLGVDVETGAERWRTVLDSQTDRAAPVVADGVVYHAGGSRLAALDLEDGTELFARSFESLFGTPIVGDGRLYVVGDFGQVIALEGSA